MIQRSLTIAHVSVFPFGLRDVFPHAVSVKLSNGLARNGHLVLNFSDRDVARAKSLLGHRKLGVRPANAALLHFCRFHKPDIVLLGHADVIRAETLVDIRDALPDVRIGQWNVDPLFEPDNVRRLRSKFGVVDATFVSTAGAPLAALRDGGKHSVSFMPNPVDFSIERGRNDLRDDLGYDLLYACGHPSRPPRHICGRDWDMNEFMSMLLGRLPRIRPLLGGLLGRPKLTGAAYQDALEQVALGLNISRRPDHYLYSSDRIVQLAGNGVVVLMERATGYGDVFSEDEMGFFDTIEELVERIESLSADPARRRRIAAAGRTRYHELFNERAVAAHLCAVLTGEYGPEAMPWRMRA
jgi:hypothetical protein